MTVRNLARKKVKLSTATARNSPSLAHDDLIALSRKDFYTFVQLMFPVLHPGTPLIYAQYIELIVEHLRVLPDQEFRRLIFNLPPGYMKSTIISVLYTAWRLGVDPTARFICISYGDDLAHELSERTRKVMTSTLFKRIFPATILEKKAQDYLRTTKGGGRYATSVGSDITGFRADEIIMDDPLQPKHASSEREKAFLRKWFYDSVITRFVDSSKGIVILVMHRLAPNDLSGVLEQVGWPTIKLPLVAEEDVQYEVDGELIFERKVGDLLNPLRMAQNDLENLKAELQPYVFEAQYQQRPSSSGSGLFAISRVSRYDRLPKFELTIHSWDLGGTVNGNYTVCTKFGLFRDGTGTDLLALFQVVRLKMLLPDVEATIEMLKRQDSPALIVIDSNGIGLGTAQSIQKKYGKDRVKTANGDSSASKIERFGLAMSTAYGGRILLPTKAPWLEAWIYEMIGFPDGEYDDQVDSFTQVAAYFPRVVRFARRPSSPGGFIITRAVGR